MNWKRISSKLNPAGTGNWLDLFNPSKVISNATDIAGMTDTGAGARGLDALSGRAQTATERLDEELKDVNKMYTDAMKNRGMSDTLNNYTSTTQTAFDDYQKRRADALDTYRNQLLGTENALGEENVRQFLNPMYSRAIQNATNQALAGAGSSLQSSAANQAVGTAVGNQVTDMWNKAFSNAMADAQNKQNIYGSNYGAYTDTADDIYGNTANLVGQQTQMNLMPSLNWAQLTSDVAGTKYTKDMDLASAAGQVAGQNQSWLANLF